MEFVTCKCYAEIIMPEFGTDTCQWCDEPICENCLYPHEGMDYHWDCYEIQEDLNDDNWDGHKLICLECEKEEGYDNDNNN